MHVEMLKDATLEQLKSFVTDFIFELDGDMHDKAEDELHIAIYGPHFTEASLTPAVAELGLPKPWTVDETNSVARQSGVTFADSNQYDWNYAMNLMRAEFGGAISDDAGTYAKLAKKFLSGKPGRAWKYYLSMRLCR